MLGAVSLHSLLHVSPFSRFYYSCACLPLSSPIPFLYMSLPSLSYNFLFLRPCPSLPISPSPIGGPISQLEAQTMTTLRAEIIADLLSKGVSTAPQVATQLVSFDQFKRAFGGDGSGNGTGNGSGPPSAGARLGEPSTADRQREA